MKTTSKLWLGLIIFALLSPLGLFLPEYFKAGDAWGEWGPETLKELVGYVPQGFSRLSALWNAPVPDYAFKGWEEKGLGDLSFAYIVSAAVGIAITVAVIVLLGRLLTRKND